MPPDCSPQSQILVSHRVNLVMAKKCLRKKYWSPGQLYLLSTLHPSNCKRFYANLTALCTACFLLLSPKIQSFDRDLPRNWETLLLLEISQESRRSAAEVVIFLENRPHVHHSSTSLNANITHYHHHTAQNSQTNTLSEYFRRPANSNAITTRFRDHNLGTATARGKYIGGGIGLHNTIYAAQCRGVQCASFRASNSAPNSSSTWGNIKFQKRALHVQDTIRTATGQNYEYWV